MKMPGQNENSLALLRRTLAGEKIPAVKKKMFGHETYFLRDYMFAGVFGDDIFVHVGIETVQASQDKGVGFFEPMGKRMRSYITLPLAMQTADTVKAWLRTGATYLKSLPAKKAQKPGKSPGKLKAAKKSSVKTRPKKSVVKGKRAAKKK